MTLRLDSEKFKKIIDKAGVSAVVLNRVLGKTDSYVQTCIRRERISSWAADMIAPILGVSTEDFTSGIIEKTISGKRDTEINWGHLHDIVYDKLHMNFDIVSRKLGMSASYLGSYYVSGSKMPYKVVVDLCDTLDIDISEIAPDAVSEKEEEKEVAPVTDFSSIENRLDAIEKGINDIGLLMTQIVAIQTQAKTDMNDNSDRIEEILKRIERIWKGE